MKRIFLCLIAIFCAAGAIVASRLACADAMPTIGELDDFVAQSRAEGTS